ncbi:hypothetical protein Bca52824_054121 [Brassica carinata]|uniref:Uncharacterized protein n=1 Tax=Brassica carinata TaxID=52824 RepID=A0A8X7UME7_BRACI|nr:hypothetical protein Bca52824_054121 [Brassica carinata]
MKICFVSRVHPRDHINIVILSVLGYALVKDPSKPEVRIYEVPADAFENDYVEEPLPDDEQVQPPEENNNAEARAGAGAVSNGASSTNEAGEDKKA